MRQVKDNAGRVRALLQRDAPGVPVLPLLVYWGRLVEPPIEPVRQVDEVRVVHGADAERWRPLLLMEDAVSQELVDRASEKVGRYVAH